jgi:phosphoribosyl 1,2-cyclic phosphodiesterase
MKRNGYPVLTLLPIVTCYFTMRNIVRPEYKNRFGWGHSSMNDAIKFATLAKAKHLLLAHHDPSHTDEQLESMLADLKRQDNNSITFELAAEGMNIEMA